VGSPVAALWMAAALAVPVRGLPAVAVMGYAAWRLFEWVRARRGRTVTPTGAQTEVETQ
jgi:hypothetical protein